MPVSTPGLAAPIYPRRQGEFVLNPAHRALCTRRKPAWFFAAPVAGFYSAVETTCNGSLTMQANLDNASIRRRPSEHVPKKLLDFFDQDMLQLFELERFLFDHVIPRDREAL
jgi:hypothetical protein